MNGISSWNFELISGTPVGSLVTATPVLSTVNKHWINNGRSVNKTYAVHVVKFVLVLEPCACNLVISTKRFTSVALLLP